MRLIILVLALSAAMLADPVSGSGLRSAASSLLTKLKERSFRRSTATTTGVPAVAEVAPWWEDADYKNETALVFPREPLESPLMDLLDFPVEDPGSIDTFGLASESTCDVVHRLLASGGGLLPAKWISQLETAMYLDMSRGGPPRTWEGFCGPKLLELIRPAARARADALKLVIALVVYLTPADGTTEGVPREVVLTGFCDEHADAIRDWLATDAWAGWDTRGDAVQLQIFGPFTLAKTTFAAPLRQMCSSLFSTSSSRAIALAHRIFAHSVDRGDRRKSGFAHFCVSRGSGFEDALDLLAGPTDVLVGREVTAGTHRNREDDAFVRISGTARIAAQRIERSAGYQGRGLVTGTRQWGSAMDDFFTEAISQVRCPIYGLFRSDELGYLRPAARANKANLRRYLGAGRLLALSIITETPVDIQLPLEYFAQFIAGRPEREDPRVDALQEGFNDLVPASLMDDLLTPKDLETIIQGEPAINIDAFIANTNLHGYSPDSPQIHWLWTLLREYDDEMRRRFIRYLTDNTQVPIGRLGALAKKVTIEMTERGALPISTLQITGAYLRERAVARGSFVLRLPAYTDEGTLRTQVTRALVAKPEVCRILRGYYRRKW